jgi:Domain of unknown function (DUF4214)
MLRSKWYKVGYRPAKAAKNSGHRQPRLRLAVEALEDRCLLSANQAFLFQTYQDLLGRTIDPDGQANWGAALDQGVSRYDVALSIMSGQEYLVRVVKDIYGTYLNRAADGGGGVFLAQQLIGGATIEEAKAFIIGSPEYFQTQAGGSNATFVANLYQKVLNRPADGPGQAGWLNTLAAGVTREQVALNFLTGPEGEVAFVRSLYQKFLHRSAGNAETSAIANQLLNHSFDQQIFAAFIASDEYYAISNAPATHFRVLVPSVSGPAGTPFSFGVEPLNQYNNLVSGYTGTVHFTSSDTSAQLPGDYTFVPDDLAFHIFDSGATIFKAGPQTITATDTATPAITGTSPPVTLNPTAATHFSITTPTTVTAGTPFTVTVTALDQNENVATGYTGPLHFLDTEPSETLPGDYTFVAGDQGVHSFQVTLAKAGTETLGVEDANPPTIVGVSSPITIQPAAASHFQVDVPPGGATAGQSIPVTVTALDAFGNVVTGYTGTVHFTSSDTAAMLPGDTTFQASNQGVLSVNATLIRAGNQTITATQTGSGTTVTGTSGPILVVAATPTHYTVSAPATATAGQPIPVTVTALDAFGNVVTDYGGTVQLTSTDPGAQLPDSYTFVSGDMGVHPFAVTLVTAGPQTVTATGDDGQGGVITGVSGTVNVSPGPTAVLQLNVPNSSATAGAAINFTITARDAFGNVTPGYTGKVSFSSSDPKAQVPGDYTFGAGDQGTHTFPATLRTAGPETITAKDTNLPAGSDAGVLVTPAAASKVTVLLPDTAVAGDTLDLLVTALDPFGNVADGYTGTVHFTSTDPGAQLPNDYTFVSDDHGQHPFQVTLVKAGPETVTAADTAQGSIKGVSNTVAVSPGVAATFQVSAPASTTAGVSFNITVKALDAFGNVATGYTGTVHFTGNDTAARLPGDYTFVASDQGVRTFPATLVTAGPETITATDGSSGSGLTGTSNSIQVLPAAASQLAVRLPDAASVGVPVTVEIAALDPFGNVATSYRGTIQFSSTDATATLPADFTFGTTDNGDHVFTGAVVFNQTGTWTVTARDKATSSIMGTSDPVLVTDG